MNKPYRKFYSRQYQSLPDSHEEARDVRDDDDVMSFSSLRLARDQDKPYSTWRGKTQHRDHRDPSGKYPYPWWGRSGQPESPSTFSSSSFTKAEEQRAIMVANRAAEILARRRATSPASISRHQPYPQETKRPDAPNNIPQSDARKSQDGILSYLACDATPAAQKFPPSATQMQQARVPDTLPSPKENRHPQNRRGSSHSISDESSTDAATRAALTPSSALNLAQFWRNAPGSMGGFACPTEQELVETAQKHIQASNKDSKDPLLVALQVVRLKRELKRLRRDAINRRSFVQRGDSHESDDAVLLGTTEPSSTRPKPNSSKRKRVHFAKNVVTEVRERPFTDPEDMEKLYFVYGELEELEWDRSTVDQDQFECIIQEASSDPNHRETYVEVEHNSRKLHVVGEDGLPHSMSDLSFY